MSNIVRALVVAGTLLGGCSNGPAGGADLAAAPPDMAFVSPYPSIPAETQRTGDPAAGYTALVNNGYVSCGIPYSLYSRFFGVAPDDQRIPGRNGHNDELPYNYNAFTTASGVEVVSANCLTCHAGRINGQLIIGLGAADADFTIDPSQQAEAAGALITDVKEKAEWRKWADRVVAIGPYTKTDTVGVNSADNLAAVLFAHRDPVTLAWSPTPLLELPPKVVIPVDVPPWWRMKKKTTMFYAGAGRGDHARIMMTASTLCTDSVAEAEAIDAYFNDVRAYITSLTPPAYPFAVDATLAAQGKQVFAASCMSCHGTYGEGGYYPNVLIPIAEINTDDLLARGGAQFAQRFVDWYKASFYGKTSRMEPKLGYIAPPLDGIWATAPYLHNASVPTLATLLDTTKRPKYWTRSFDSSDYDQAALGWNFSELDHGKADEPAAQQKKLIYDTTLLGYANTGHAYGDHLTDEQRTALLEYLKTL